ncbi:hypothetical protein WG66_008024 [Moniliophthora roreri]|nr:hypothetical protein WG66_008024 [Moniliophthora roreri]
MASGSRPRREEPVAEEAVIGSAMPVQVVSAVKEVKAALPRAFTGAWKDAKKFLREVLIYVALNPKAFPDDRSKKLFLLSYMTDGPGEFWKNEKTDLLLAFDADAEKVTWSEFLDDFRTSFEPLDPALKAQLELKNLKMKERADEYTYQFTYLAKQTGYNDAAQIVAFKRGLLKSLVFKIMTRPEGVPSTIKEWMNAAIIFDEKTMAEDKKPSGSRPRREEPVAEEAVIGSAMPVQVVSAVKEVKAALPRAFMGARKDAKKFLREVLIYVALNPKAFLDDRSKKLFLLSYMTDGPGEFWKNEKTDLLLAFDADAEKVTWSEFLDDFRTSFEPLDPALKAQLELKDLKMKERADEYTYQFTYLAKQTGYNDAAQIVAFKRGLLKSLIPERCQNTLIPSPSTSSTVSDDEQTGTDIPVPTSTTTGASSLGSPTNPWTTKSDSPPLPVPPPIPTTPLFILTPLPIPTSNIRSSHPSPSTSSTVSDDEQTGTDIPVPTSTTTGASSLGSPTNPWATKSDSPPLPVPPPIPTMPSFILTPLPIPTSNIRSSQSTPLPPLNPNLRPPLTPEIFRRLKPQFHLRVEHIPMVGGEVALAESEAGAEDEDRENRTPENVEDPPIISLRSLTPAPTPMMQLVDRVSALCADWSTISPDIARSTCVADASRLSLDIHLDTALTNEGLAALRVGGLIRAQTLCRMVAVMTMSETITTSPTTISEGNVEMLVKEYDQDAQLLFVGADPKKVRLLSVEEQQAMGWQPPTDPPATPMMEVEDEMPEIDDRPDTSYDYNAELYGDGES